ncbi:MAG TPA: single-stranded DNA-binding protein [Clostridiales bacterium]|nr:single-stranded DNA-binding protein [Clostridiales bacterium]
MLNKAILMGRLTRDPELRYTPNGNVPVVSFSIAVERNYSGSNRERITDFIDIVAWRRTAEFVSQWFTKGMMIVVVGSIQTRRWQDKNGNNRTSVEVVADEVQFGESKKSRESNSGYQGGYTDSYAAPQQPSAPSHPAPSFDMPTSDSDFSEISDDDGEVPF